MLDEEAFDVLAHCFKLKISVVTVCLNAKDCIGECLSSVAAQSYQKFQHIVVDGGSTDGTLDVVRTFSHVDVIVSEPDEGLYDAMNKGLRYADGDYIVFLNADDFFTDSNVLAAVVSELVRNPVDLAYGQIIVRDPYKEDFVYDPPDVSWVIESLSVYCLPHQATFARSSLFKRIGGFSTVYRVLADYEWFLRALLSEATSFARLPIAVASYSMDGLSADPRKRLPEFFRIQNCSFLLTHLSREDLTRRYRLRISELNHQLAGFGSCWELSVNTDGPQHSQDDLRQLQNQIVILECKLFDLQREAAK